MKTRNIVSLVFIAMFVYAGIASALTESNSPLVANNYFGYNAGGASGNYNSFFGHFTGDLNTGDSNSFFGAYAGYENGGNSNTFIGIEAGSFNTIGSSNIFIGPYSGNGNMEGSNNIFIGLDVGVGVVELLLDNGIENTIIGNSAGYKSSGDSNVFLGYQSGYNSMGDRNVFLGYKAGYNETGSDKLYIDNSDTTIPLIYGDFAADTLVINGALTANSFSGDGSGLTNIPASVHTHSGGDITSGIVSDTYIDPVIARDTEVTSVANALNSHTTTEGNDNPHIVTAVQVGAAAAEHGHSGSDISSGLVGEIYIEATIARDSEVTLAVNSHGNLTNNPHSVTAAQTGAADATHNHDADYVNVSGGTMSGDMSVNSNFFVTGTAVINTDLYVDGNIYAESDASSKKDIQQIKSSMHKINSINGVSFSWKDREEKADTLSEGRHYGVIAQEVEEVLPEVVKTGNNGKKKVAYIELIPVLIEAVKEQQQTISGLSEKINELERELKLRGSMAMVD